ncbi:MAG: type II toxin-antitoxin system VapC family toxin [Sphingomonadaceae bacterium]
MRLLLDTHALLWAFLESPRLSARAREALASSANAKLVSAATAMEITLKHRLGKLSDAAPFIRDGRLAIGHLDYVALPISLDHASLAGGLDIPHRDPFDRLLIAQARIERVPIVSSERLFDGFGVERIW